MAKLARNDATRVRFVVRARHVRAWNGGRARRRRPSEEGADLDRDRRALCPVRGRGRSCKIFEKYGLETSFKPFDDGNVALDALLTGNSDIGATTELGGLSRWDKGGKLYVTSYSSTSGKQIGLAGRDDIKKPEDLIGRTVAYPRATGGHLYFMRYVKKYNLPVDKIKVKLMQAPEMVAALERRDIDAFFLWEPWLDKAAQLVQGAKVLAGSGDDGVSRSHVLRLLLPGTHRRSPARRGGDARAYGSDGFLRQQPGRGGQAGRQGFPDSGSRYESSI